jgi:hypothetical protein
MKRETEELKAQAGVVLMIRKRKIENKTRLWSSYMLMASGGSGLRTSMHIAAD